MHLKLIREPNSEATPGRLYNGQTFLCYTIEDKDRGLTQKMSLADIQSQKVAKQTAIPRGTYEIALTFSARFERVLPLLLAVPGFQGVRLHPGNTTVDTDGCILPGDGRNGNAVTNSRPAFSRLLKQIQLAAKTGKVFITIQ